jgi:hypothetical protein
MRYLKASRSQEITEKVKGFSLSAISSAPEPSGGMPMPAYQTAM